MVLLQRIYLFLQFLVILINLSFDLCYACLNFLFLLRELESLTINFLINFFYFLIESVDIKIVLDYPLQCWNRVSIELLAFLQRIHLPFQFLVNLIDFFCDCSLAINRGNFEDFIIEFLLDFLYLLIKFIFCGSLQC